MGAVDNQSESDVAIVGIGIHVPGASSPAELWANLRDGVESVRTPSEEELLAAGVSRDDLADPHYVRATADLADMAMFDAEFFGFSPKDAAIMDPQHRHFLTACWEALEDAAHPPESFDGAIGVFAGCGMGNYFFRNLLTNPGLVDDVGLFLLRHTGNDKDFLATRASYLFDLRGPSINVQTACSTSLVAVHLAIQHLLSGECDLALAGGVTIEMPHGQGYRYEPGEILSPDGHCRAFDERSQGTVFGSGAGVVVLRRLADALADGDHVYAVLKGTAVNNDGAGKIGYLAPSVDGQAACVAEALGVAGVDPGEVDYVECHGTGTPVGDPIEVAALTQAFAVGAAGGECRIGSIKTNIGHLDTAAGVASLAKVALALEHEALPPSLHFERPNPTIDFAGSPFRVNERLRPWPRDPERPRFAGVNSLGVGGTNAFAVVQEGPSPSSVLVDGGRGAVPASSRAWRTLAVSGRTPAALDANCRRLAAHLRAHPEVDLADVAWTLQVGRRHFAERRVVVARDAAEAADLLDAPPTARSTVHRALGTGPRRLAFLLPGGGAQYPRMAAGLYEREPEFRRWMDDGFALLERDHAIDLRPLLLCADEPEASTAAATALEQPSLQLPAIFLIEHALARLLEQWGIVPDALIGHSVGENTAACLAGTMSFADCLGLVVLRGQLMDRTAGGMLSVHCSAEAVAPLLAATAAHGGLDLAAINAPDLCVASGTTAALAELEGRLDAAGIEHQRVRINIAAHSRLLDPVLDEFRAYLRSIRLSPPTLPWVSNRTGTWITDAEATDPEYWVGQLRNTVRFTEGIDTICADADLTFVEVGPGRGLGSLARSATAFGARHAALATLRHPDERVDDHALAVGLAGRLWGVGGEMPTDRWFAGEHRRRVQLPTYAFQAQRYFVEPGRGAPAHVGAAAGDAASGERDDDPARWCWEEAWRAEDVADADVGRDGALDAHAAASSWLVVLDELGVGAEIARRLRGRGGSVVTVRTGPSYRRIDDHTYQLAPEQGADGYESLVRDLVRSGRLPDVVVHLPLLATAATFRMGSSMLHRNQELGFYALVHLGSAWAAEGIERPWRLVVATSGAQRVLADDPVTWPDQATVLGPASVLPREVAGCSVVTVDVDPRSLVEDESLVDRLRRSVLRPGGGARGALVDALERELLAPDPPATAPESGRRVALRGTTRFVRRLRRAEIGDRPLRRLADRGVVLVTGGLGGIGLALAEELATAHRARLVLVSRAGLPEASTWDDAVARLGDDHPTSRRIRAVQHLEALGAEVLVVAADVADARRMRDVVDEVTARFGGIDAVVHAAGTLRQEVVASATATDVEEVFGPKVYGTLVLADVVPLDRLAWFVVCSSTSTELAPVGQAAYVGANAFLDAFVRARHAAGQHQFLSIAWGVWSEVGMGVDAAHAAGHAPAGPIEQPCRHPWFTTWTVDRHGRRQVRGRWSTDEQWVLDEHRTADGQALLPGAAYPELLAAALAEIGEHDPFEIHELLFLAPLAVTDHAVEEIVVDLTPTAAGYGAVVRCRPADVPDAPWSDACEATLLLTPPAAAPAIDVAAALAACPRPGPLATAQQRHLRFGPRWQVVRDVRVGEGRAVAQLALPAVALGDLPSGPGHEPDRSRGPVGHGIGLHPALVDLGTGFAIDLVHGYTGDVLWVPLGYRAIRLHAPLPAEVTAVAQVRAGSSEASGFATFDVAFVDAAGRVLLDVEGFTMKRLDGPLRFETSSGRALAAGTGDRDAPTGPSAGDRSAAASPAERLFRRQLATGIRTAEGRAVFASLTEHAAQPCVLVSPVDLPAAITATAAAAAAQLAPPAADAAMFGRPELASTYVAPRDEIEATLVTMWQGLLGVRDIGVQDDFFDLGGHSLVAVRLFAQVKRTFGVEFPISVLFDAPTVEACARLIAAAAPAPVTVAAAAAAPSGPPASVVTAPARRFQHLVRMSEGARPDATPLFMVAGMGGNVLNLRSLATLVGADRPFYGLQARGVVEGEVPHETFEEAARDYLGEIRTVQPHGPYLLGGYSGGGIAALEMALQLRDAGEEVALLTMLDTPLPWEEHLTRKERLLVHLHELRRNGPGYLVARVRDRVRDLRRRGTGPDGTGADAAGAGVGGPAGPGNDAELRAAAELEVAFRAALARYTVRRYDGPVLLFRPFRYEHHVLGPDRSIDITWRVIQNDNGWGRFCSHVEVQAMPGDHFSMVLEPNVRVLVGELRTALSSAERASRPR